MSKDTASPPMPCQSCLPTHVLSQAIIIPRIRVLATWLYLALHSMHKHSMHLGLVLVTCRITRFSFSAQRRLITNNPACQPASPPRSPMGIAPAKALPSSLLCGLTNKTIESYHAIKWLFFQLQHEIRASLGPSQILACLGLVIWSQSSVHARWALLCHTLAKYEHSCIFLATSMSMILICVFGSLDSFRGPRGPNSLYPYYSVDQ